MSRIATGQPIIVRASNNIYTVLAGTAVLTTFAAVIVVFVKGSQIGFKWFSPLM